MGLTPDFATGPDMVAGSPEVFGWMDGGDRFADGSGFKACDGRLGFSVGSATLGSAVDPTRFAARVVGCPAETGDRGGVFVMAARTSEGTHEALTMGSSDEVTHMEGSWNLGFSVLGVDLVACHGPFPSLGCGEEILVGAPNLSGSGPGKVRWFTADNGTVRNPSLVHQGDIVRPDPTDFPAGSFFGSALAAPHYAIAPDDPWNDVPHTTRWVAVGAPGALRVAVFDVDQTVASPFTWSTTLVGAGDFGTSIVSGFFDEDVFPDLAVGEPNVGTAVPGRVHVFLGTTVYGGFPATADLVITPSDMTGETITASAEFGFALAAGPIDASVNHDALVIGIPGQQGETGMVCQVTTRTLSSTGSFGILRTRCDDHLPDINVQAGDRFGHAVAVGNFVNSDSMGNQHDPPGQRHPLAAHPEVAVGAPGWDDYLGGPAAPDTGRVYLIPTDTAGLVPDTRYAALDNPAKNHADEAFGWSLHAYHVQETFWEDLLIGIPGIAPTTSSSWGGFAESWSPGFQACEEVVDQWLLTDSSGVGRQVRIWQDGAGFTHVKFLQPFVVRVFENGVSTDPICAFTPDGGGTISSITVPAGTDMPLGGAWACIGGPGGKNYSSVPGEPVLAAINFALTGESKAPLGRMMSVDLAFDPGGTSSRTDDLVDVNFDVSTLGLDDLDLDPTCNIPGPLAGTWSARVTE